MAQLNPSHFFRIALAAGAAGLIAGSANAQPAPGCDARTTRIFLAADFKWGGAGPARPMKLLIAKVRSQRDPLAIIRSAQGCEATCQVKAIETDSVELACRSHAFAPLSAPATIFLAAHRDHRSTLRFGTWLQGYQQATLHIQLDRSAELVSPISPVQIARAR